MRFVVLLLSCTFLISCHGIKSTIPQEILAFENPVFKKVLHDSKYEFQVIYTSVEKKGDLNIFNSYSFGLDTNFYFYPASTIKMPTAFLAVERMNEIKGELGIDQNELLDLVIDSIRPIQSKAYLDTTTLSGKPNVLQYVKKIFAVSDNDAYNRLYEFLGSDYINAKLKAKNIFGNSRIRHRVGVSGFTPDEQQHTNPLMLLQGDSVVYSQKEKYAQNTSYPELNSTLKGKGYYKDGQKISEAFDMSRKNFINLKDLESCLMHFLFPENFPVEERFKISDAQHKSIKDAMHWVPRKHKDLNYDTSYYYDSYGKFFIYGDSKDPIPDSVKIYNKVGYAYGYLTDVAYIEDLENDISFFLTATILVNENETFNDNKYEYDDLGIPFLAELGRRVYQYELQKRK